MNSSVRQAVAKRADDFCEYCRIHVDVMVSKHHVEHIQAKQHGGTSDLENLAYACHSCNEQKGAELNRHRLRNG